MRIPPRCRPEEHLVRGCRAIHQSNSVVLVDQCPAETNCIVQPKTTNEVSEVVKTLVAGKGCRQTGIALRSGGHTTWAGSNNINGGVTIDLGLMNTTVFDPMTKIASIQPGSRWNQVYATLDPLGFTVAGGRAGSVGVAGFLMGGGNSFYASRQGFACDDVKNFEIVLASGSVPASPMPSSWLTRQQRSDKCECRRRAQRFVPRAQRRLWRQFWNRNQVRYASI